MSRVSSPSFAINSYRSDYNGVIDGRYSFCDDNGDYVAVEVRKWKKKKVAKEVRERERGGY